MRAVVDLLVAAVLTPRGGSAEFVAAIDAGAIDLVVSARLLGELDAVLHRDKFRRWVSVERAEEFLTALRERAESIADPEEVPEVTPDRDDDYLAALARSAQADVLISGDADLTELNLTDVPTLSPRQVLDELGHRKD